MHDKDEDKEFVIRAKIAWELLHDPVLNLPDEWQEVKVFQQKGQYKYGYLELYNMEVFSKHFLYSNAPAGFQSCSEMFYKEVCSVVKIIDLHVGVIKAMAEELNATSISEDYEPSYRVAFPKDNDECIWTDEASGGGILTLALYK